MAGAGGAVLTAGGVAAASIEVEIDRVPPHAAKREIFKMTKIDFGEPATGAGMRSCLVVSWLVESQCFSIDASR
jgi:hypothetical protein